MKQRLNLTPGQKIGKLTVIKEAEKHIQPSGQKNRMFLCLCDCGNESIVYLSHLTRGNSKSCGHCNGVDGLYGSKIHNTWRAMLYRVKQSYFQSHLYSQKGITVTDEWRVFKNFKEWAYKNGYNDSLYIDRIDNSKGYYPDNCRFTTAEINSSNRDSTFKVNYKGKFVPLTILLRELNIIDHIAAIRMRIKRGWNDQLAIETPIKKGNYYRKLFLSTNKSKLQ